MCAIRPSKRTLWKTGYVYLPSRFLFPKTYMMLLPLNNGHVLIYIHVTFVCEQKLSLMHVLYVRQKRNVVNSFLIPREETMVLNCTAKKKNSCDHISAIYFTSYAVNWICNYSYSETDLFSFET